MTPKSGRGPSAVLCLFVCVMSARADTPAPTEALPQPLSLGQALELSEDHHPTLARSRAALALARAERLRTEADDNLEVGLSLDARYVEPAGLSALGLADEHNDSRAELYVSKRLYDFGRSSRSVEAAQADERSRSLVLQDERARQRLRIMQTFFNVILSDMEAARDTEAMATAFVTLDRARDRNALGQVSDVDVLALDDAYQAQLARLRASESRQRSSRSLLAQALNRPRDLPGELLKPELPGNRTPLPDYETLVGYALAHNPRYLAQSEALEAARLKVEASRALARPTLSTEISATAYEQDVGSRDPFRASLILDIPLYTGGRVDARVAEAQAQSDDLKARLRELEFALRQDLLETWQAIQNLHTRREQARVRLEYRDLYLDRSRARYELDIEADLGDAMAEQTGAFLFEAQTEFELALAWARIALLTGEPAFDPLLPPAQKPRLEKTQGGTP